MNAAPKRLSRLGFVGLTLSERSARVRDADGAGSAASHSLLIPAPFAEYRSRGDSFRE
jgi:hypothetical protein